MAEQGPESPPDSQSPKIGSFSSNKISPVSSVIVKGVEGGFTAGVARDVFESTGLR